MLGRGSVLSENAHTKYLVNKKKFVTFYIIIVMIIIYVILLIVFIHARFGSITE